MRLWRCFAAFALIAVTGGPGVVSAQVVSPFAISGLCFDTGSSTLQPASEDALATIVDYLAENPDRQFYVVGHTDDEGNFDNNMRLSSARAEAVISAITDRLPRAGQQLSSYGVGPRSPVATNDDGGGRTLNRRVELVSRIAN